MHTSEAYAILRNMRSVAAGKIVDALVTAFIALVIGLLFAWWAGAVVFLLGLAVLLRKRAMPPSPLAHDEAETSDQESEWYFYRYGLHHRDINKD